MRRGITIVSAIALVASAAAIAITMTPAAAGPPPPTLNQYVILGTDGVTIGVGSTIVGLVGDFNDNPINNLALRMNGQAQIVGDASKGVVGDARIGGNTRLDNNAHIEGTLYHPAGSTVNLGSGATIGSQVVGDPQLPSLPAPTPIPVVARSRRPINRAETV